MGEVEKGPVDNQQGGYFAQLAWSQQLNEGTRVWLRDPADELEAKLAFIAVFENEDPNALLRDLEALQNEMHNLLVDLRKQMKALENGEGQLMNPQDAETSGPVDVNRDTHDDVPSS